MNFHLNLRTFTLPLLACLATGCGLKGLKNSLIGGSPSVTNSPGQDSVNLSGNAAQGIAQMNMMSDTSDLFSPIEGDSRFVTITDPSKFNSALNSENKNEFAALDTAEKSILSQAVDSPSSPDSGVIEVSPPAQTSASLSLDAPGTSSETTTKTTGGSGSIAGDPTPPVAPATMPNAAIPGAPVINPNDPISAPGRPAPNFPVVLPPGINPPNQVVGPEVCYLATAIVKVIVKSQLSPANTWIGSFIWGGGIAKQEVKECYSKSLSNDQLNQQRQAARDIAYKFARSAATDQAQQNRTYYCQQYIGMVTCKPPRVPKDFIAYTLLKKDQQVNP